MFIGGLASFDVIFSTVGRRTVVGAVRPCRQTASGRAFGRAFSRTFGRTFGRTSGQAVVGGARAVSSAEKKHLIEAAPFGRLDQMLRTTEWCRKKKH